MSLLPCSIPNSPGYRTLGTGCHCFKHHKIIQCLSLRRAESDPKCDARADLKFHSSSRMKPRWLAFALTLPTDDVLFVQYTVPTIVMSRQCDQHSKVLALHAYLHT